MTNKAFITKTIMPYLLGKKPYGIDTKTGECLYRTKAGAACAVGQYINPSTYRRDMEHLSLKELLEDEADCFYSNTVSRLSKEEWICIQSIHDRCASVSSGTGKYSYDDFMKPIVDLEAHTKEQYLKIRQAMTSIWEQRK